MSVFCYQDGGGALVTRCTAPTAVTLDAALIDASATTTLRWTGAVGGAGNPIRGYEVYRDGALLATALDGASITVTASGTMGAAYHYTVKTLGQIPGFDSGISAASAVLTAQTYSAVGAPEVLGVSATNVGYGQGVTLSWSGAKAGTNNPITGYEIWRATSANGTYSRLTSLETSATSGSISVTSPANNSSYYYKVKTLGTKSGFADSGLSANYATLTSNVTAVGAPTAISLSANNVGFGASVTLSWSGGAHGTNNNVKGYEVWRSTSASGTYTKLTSVTTSAGSGSVAVTSPGNNSSYYYKVKTIGTVSGHDSGLSGSYATLTSKVTAPSVPGSVRLDATGLRVGKNTTLRWNASSAGTNNAVAKYQVNRNGAYLTETTGTSCTVTAPGNDGGQYTYTVVAIGSVSGWNSGASAGATLTGYTEKWTAQYFESNGTYVVPSWAERVDACCIGASGGTTPKWQKVGTAGSGAGYMSNVFGLSVTPGQSLAIVVGKGGAVGHGPTWTGGPPTPGTDGGASNVTRGGTVLASAAGSRHGDPGYTLASGIQVAGVGTDGSAGSGGGGSYTGVGGEYTWNGGNGGNGIGTTGGAHGDGWANGGGGGGSYKGENGKTAGNWGGAAAPAIGTTNANEYYCFNDPASGHYLQAIGGDGSVGTAETYGTPKGGPGGRMGAMCSGVGHGRGANAGDAGSNGFVALRAWRYLN